MISCQHLVGHSNETAVDNTEEGGDDVKSSCLLRLGLHTCYNGQVVTWSETQKTVLSSDCGLQPAHMKMELLVIPDQHAGVNAFSGLVHTARQAMGVGGTQSR